MAGAPIEAKAVAAPSVTLVAGYLSAVLIQTVPWLRDNLTPDQQANVPIVLAFALSALAAYLAPHTHRPDLAPVTPAPGMVATTTWAPGAAPPPVLPPAVDETADAGDS